MTTLLRRMMLASASPLLVIVALAAQASPSPPTARERTVVLNDQETFAPGYPIGDVAIAQPKIADFKVMRGRRELLILGKGLGSTRLTVWDQQHVKRDDVIIHVTARQAALLERDLRLMLKDFPTIRITTFGGGFAIAGTVNSRDDLMSVSQVASAGQVLNLVRYVPAVTSPAGAGSAAPAADPSGLAGAAISGVATHVEYEVNCFEASAAFRTGSYKSGVEPSGRRLCQCRVTVPVYQQQAVLIGGMAGGPVKTSMLREATLACPDAPGELPATGESGMRLTIKAGTPDPRGVFQTSLLIETNLPFDGKTYDPATWRRANWQFSTASGEAFGVAGNDLLATAPVQPSRSKLGTVAQTGGTVAAVPGATSVPGLEYLGPFRTLFGSSAYKLKTTQLVLVLHPRIIVGERPSS